jgi:hypothetical protein
MTTMYDADRTTSAPRGDDATVVSAWSSSPLGAPSAGAAYADHTEYADETVCAQDAAYSAYRDDFTPDPVDRVDPVHQVDQQATPRSFRKVILAATLLGTVGLSAVLGAVLLADSGQPKTVAVAPGSAGAPAAVPAAVATVVTPTDNPPAPPPVISQADNGPAPAVVLPPPADPGTPPTAKPPGPVVEVNPAPPPIWAPPKPPQWAPPSPPKQQPWPPKQQPWPPKQSTPVLCLPPHHLVQGVCK